MYSYSDLKNYTGYIRNILKTRWIIFNVLNMLKLCDFQKIVSSTFANS